MPLPKMDILAVNESDVGAMENWVNTHTFCPAADRQLTAWASKGLITARQVIYMYDPEKSDILAKKRVVVTQSHECAHMYA